MKSNASAKALVPMSIPNDIQGLDGLEGEYMSADRFIKALAHSGYRAKIVPRDGDVDPYITIGGKIEFDFDAINKAKKAKGINTNDNKVVNPPNTTVFNKGTNNNTNFNLTTGKTTFNDKALNVAKNKFAFSNAVCKKFMLKHFVIDCKHFILIKIIKLCLKNLLILHGNRSLIINVL